MPYNITMPKRLPPSLIAVVVILAFLCGVAVGYYLRMNQEDVMAARVILHDAKDVAKIEKTTKQEQVNVEQKKQDAQKYSADECLTKPLPFDFSLQPRNN